MKNRLVVFSLITLSLGLIALLLISLFYNRDGHIEIEKAKKESEILVVDFWSEGCGPCRKLSPIIDEISTEFPDVKFMKVDINGEKGLHEEYDIEFVPTVIIFYMGKEFVRLVGLREKKEYVEYIETLKNQDEGVIMKFEWNKNHE